MRHIPSAALLAAAILLPGSSAAQAAEPGWYLGAGVGRSMFSSPPITYFTFASIPAKGEIDTLDLRPSGGRVYGGFRVNRYFALEAGYADLGQITFAKKQRPGPGCTVLPIPNPNCPSIHFGYEENAGEISTHGWNLGARGSLPLGERLELSGKLGILRSTATVRMTQDVVQSFEVTSPVFIERTVRRTSTLFGVGMSYRVSPKLSLTLDWEQSKVGSADTTGEMSLRLLSGGVRLDF